MAGIESRSKRNNLLNTVMNAFSNSTPSDEYYDPDAVEGFEDVSSNTGEITETVGREVSTEEVMSVFGPTRRRNNSYSESNKNVNQEEPSTYSRTTERTRVKTITAATPNQLEDKLNEYLNTLETDPRLSNLSLEDIKYAANNQGYSCLVILKMLVDVI